MSKQKTIIFTLLAIIILIVIAFGVHNQIKMNGEDENVIKIGAILPLTGTMSSLGNAERLGLEAAVAELNARGDRKKIRLVIEDSKGDVKSAVMSAQKLINGDNLKAVITSLSGVSKAVAPVFDKAEIPMLSLCSDTTIAESHNNCINFYVNLEAEQDELVKYLKQHDIKKIVVLRVNAEAGALAVDLLKKKYPSLIISAEWTYDLDKNDFKDIVANIENSETDFLYIVGVGIKFPVILNSLWERKTTKKIIGNYMFSSSSASSITPEILKNVVFTTFPITAKSLSTTNLGQYFSSQGIPLPQFLDYVFAYDAIKFLDYQLQDLKLVGNFIPQVKGGNFSSLFGNMEIRTDGNAFVPMRMGRYNDNRKIELLND